MNGSVRLSVRLSVTHFWPCSPQLIIMKFSGLFTNDRSDVHVKGKGQRSKVKVTGVNTQLSHSRTVTLDWIHIWWWNNAQSLMLMCPIVFQGHPSNFKVTRLKKSSILTQIGHFQSILTPDYNSRHQWLQNTVKPVYNDHLIGYFSAFWSSSK